MKTKNVYEKLRQANLPIYIWGNGEIAINSQKKLSQEGIAISGFVTDDGFLNAGGVEKQWILDNVERYILIRGFLEAFFIQDSEIMKQWEGCEKVYSVMDCYTAGIDIIETMTEEYFIANKARFSAVRDLLEDSLSKRSMDAYIHAKLQGECEEIRDLVVWPQYFFENAPWSYLEDEVLVDCGAYNGDSIAAFRNLRGNHYDFILACEPDEKNYSDLLAYVEENQIRNVLTYPVGVYNCQTQLFFEDEKGTTSGISDHGRVEINVDSIDHIAQDKKVSIIKMDIEGSEMKALDGAKYTIQRNRPILMITAYHKKDDIFRIFEFVNDLVPDYKFYFRCHRPLAIEAVLYAVPNERVR